MTNKYNEVSTLSIVFSSILEEDLDTNYMGRDHDEGFYVVKEKNDE